MTAARDFSAGFGVSSYVRDAEIDIRVGLQIKVGDERKLMGVERKEDVDQSREAEEKR
jgi:hypothetical protein